MNQNLKDFLQISFGLMSGAMICLVLITSLRSNMFQLPTAVLQEPWFWTTLVDFYFNITILSIWVLYKEKHLWIAVLWIFAFITMGSIATCFYVFWQFKDLKEKEGFAGVLLQRTKG